MTATGIMVPKARAEAPTAGGDNIFPEGLWSGALEEVRPRPFPDFIARDIADGKTNRGYTSGDGEIFGLQFGSNESLEGGPDVGSQKVFVDFVVRDGKVEITDAAAIPDTSWQMQRSAALLVNLALALGATNEVEYNGQTYLETTPDFLDQLRNGDFKGARVGFRVVHRKWESKATGKSGTEVN